MVTFGHANSKYSTILGVERLTLRKRCNAAVWNVSRLFNLLDLKELALKVERNSLNHNELLYKSTGITFYL